MAITVNVTIPSGESYIAVATDGEVLIEAPRYVGGWFLSLEYFVGGDPDDGGSPSSTAIGHMVPQAHSLTLSNTEWLYVRSRDAGITIPMTATNPLNYDGA